jgi:hypothetical protein
VHGDLYGQFFGNFPAQAVFRGFSGLDFPAGKLPFEGHGHAEVPLGRQHPAVMFDDGAGDMQGLDCHDLSLF